MSYHESSLPYYTARQNESFLSNSICSNLQDKAHIKCLEIAFVFGQLSIIFQYEGFNCNCTSLLIRIMGIDLQILQ